MPMISVPFKMGDQTVYFAADTDDVETLRLYRRMAHAAAAKSLEAGEVEEGLQASYIRSAVAAVGFGPSPAMPPEQMEAAPITSDLHSQLAGFVGEIQKGVKECEPDKTTVEVGISLDVKTGPIARLVLGEAGASGSIKVTMEWGKKDAK